MCHVLEFFKFFYLLLTVLFVGAFVAYILSKKELLYNVDGSIKNQIFHEAKSRWLTESTSTKFSEGLQRVLSPIISLYL